MDLLLSLISFLLVAGGGSWQHASLADATGTAAATTTETATAYWQAVLPGVPMPPAISDLLVLKKEQASLEDGIIHGLATLKIAGSDNLKFVKRLRKFGPGHGRVSSEADQEGLKKISVSYDSEGEEDLKKGTIVNMSQLPKYLQNLLMRSQVEENSQEVSVSYGSEDNEDVKKITVSYREDSKEALNKITSFGAHGEEDVKEISMSYGAEAQEDVKEVTMSYGAEAQEDVKEISMSYGAEAQEDVKEISMSYGAEAQEDVKEVTMSYGAEAQEDVKEVTMSYEAEAQEDVKEVTMSYGAEAQEDVKEISMSYGAEAQEDVKEVTMSYGAEAQEDVKEISMSYGAEAQEDVKEVTMSYGAEPQDVKKVTMSYGAEPQEDIKKITMSYGAKTQEDGSEHDNNPKKDSRGHGSHSEGERRRYHVHANSHTKQRLADVFFFHDMLRPGSRITPTIPPTTSLPALLPRHVAEAIPFSVDRLPDILAMFAPAPSATTAREIRWALDTCDHRRRPLLPGERAGCATSLESLADLAASLVGTRDVRAFSADGLPVEAAGTPALRGRHNVTAVRRLHAAESSSEEDVVTCHDLTYPYAVFYCHTSSPTAAYAVTLQASDTEDGAAPATMEALAVCHLDTSRWPPEHPFFVAHGLRPGEVAVCHFLSKLSIVWVRAGGDRQGYASA